MVWKGHVPFIVAKSNASRVLVGKPEGKSLRRHGRRCEYGMKMVHTETGWGVVD
jgi:hypothetical protein